MAFSYDPTTDAGRVRMLITDRDEANAIFTDAEIDAFLDMQDDSIPLAAAQALRTIAASEVLILKKIQTLDLITDGSAVARSLMELADKIEAREAAGGSWDIAEQVNTSWGYEERVGKQFLRGGY